MVKSQIKPLPKNAPITEHLAYLLAQASREINRQLDARLRQEGVPIEQWRILKVLSDGKGHSMGELADAVLLNHPTLTKMIDRMASDALVYRLQDADDRRKVLMYCSDRGKALAQRLNLLGAQPGRAHRGKLRQPRDRGPQATAGEPDRTRRLKPAHALRRHNRQFLISA